MPNWNVPRTACLRCEGEADEVGSHGLDTLDIKAVRRSLRVEGEALRLCQRAHQLPQRLSVPDGGVVGLHFRYGRGVRGGRRVHQAVKLPRRQAVDGAEELQVLEHLNHFGAVVVAPLCSLYVKIDRRVPHNSHQGLPSEHALAVFLKECSLLNRELIKVVINSRKVAELQQ